LIEALSDVTFVAEGKKLFGHKAILTCRSLFFAELLRNLDGSKVQVLPGTYKANVAILEYLYEEKTDFPPELLKELAMLTHRRKETALNTICQVQLVALINYDTFLDIYKWAHQDPTLDHWVVRNALRHWIGFRVGILKANPLWKTLSKEHKLSFDSMAIEGNWVDPEAPSNEKCIIS